MHPEPDEIPDARIDAEPEDDDLVARARAAVLEMRRQAVAGGLDAEPEEGAPGDLADGGEGGDAPAPKRRRRKKGAGRAA